MLEGSLPGESDDTVLGGHVSSARSFTAAVPHGGGVVDDDTSAALEHGADLCPHAAEHGGEIHCDHLVPRIVGVSGERLRTVEDTRVVERQIELPKAFDRRRHQGGDLGRGAEISCVEVPFAAGCADARHDRVSAPHVAPGDHYLGSRLCERDRGRLANTGRGSGDQRHTTLEEPCWTAHDGFPGSGPGRAVSQDSRMGRH